MSHNRQSKLPEHIQKQLAAFTSSSYRETVQRGFTCFSVGVPRDTIIATQRALVDNAMSMQELMSQIFRMIAEKNPVFNPVFDYARLNPVRGGYDYVIINENSLYSMIEEARRTDDQGTIADDSDSMSFGTGSNDKVKAASLNFRTYKQDEFMKRRVIETLAKLKQGKSRQEFDRLATGKSVKEKTTANKGSKVRKDGNRNG